MSLHPAAGPLPLSEIIAGLSCALDLTEGQRQGHAVRTCIIGMRIADIVGLDDEQRSSLFYALLLKDLGCSSNAARFAALFGAHDQDLKAAIKTINWTRAIESYRFVTRNVAPGAFWWTRVWRTLAVAVEGQQGAREVVRTRCERGADIARLIGFADETSQAIRALDEHWNGRGQPYGLAGGTIPLLGRILGLAQTVEVFATTYNPGVALDMAATRRGRWFDPDLVDALQSLRSDDDFWRGLASDAVFADVQRLEPAGRAIGADEATLDRVAEAFARVVDAKSPWTYRHSNGVAHYATAIGERLGLGPDALSALRRAALLHDLGKLGVSSLILDKPGRLTDEEMRAMKRHPASTFEILNRVGAFRPIAAAAAAHHEKINGTGYHLRLKGSELPQASKILCVADICDALRASRPYREGLPTERALEIMGRDVGTGIDPDCFAALGLVLMSDAAGVPAAELAPAVNSVPALAEDYHQAA